MNRKHHRLLASVATIALSTSAASAAFAQDTQQTAASQSVSLEEVVVTAQRREENLQKTALAVSAVTGDTLTRSSVTQATDLTRLVPAIQIAPAAAFTQIYLRGVGTFGANAFAEQGVAFNLDGVYLSRPAAPAGLFYDLERIEVLKGPQGTLYGRNATGGAVNVITAKPKLGETGGNLSAEYGNYAATKASGAVNVPIGETAALRVSGQYAKHDGYFSDGYDDEDTKAVRAQLRFQPDGPIDVLLSADYADVGGKGSGGAIMPLVDGDARLGPSDPRVLAAYLARTPTAPVPQLIAKDDGYQDNRFKGVSATINADLGFAKLTIIPAWRKTDLDFRSYASSFLIDITEASEQRSLEARLGGSTDRLNWVVGAYGFSEDVDADQLFDQASNASYIRSKLKTRSLAAFGQATWSLSDQLRVTGGLRYTKDNKKQDSYSENRPFVGFAPPVGPTFTPIILVVPTTAATDVDFKKATWKAGLEYDLAERSLLYANVATGFKSGVLFAASGKNYSQPEMLTAYTIGSKNRFLDNRLQLNVETFYWDYKDQQISHLGAVQVATTPGGPIYGPLFTTENAGKAAIYGAEADVMFQATANDLVTANLQYLHAQYDDLKYQAYSTTGAAPAVGCAVALTSQTGTSAAAKIYNVDCSGRPVVNAPRYVINLGYEHRFPLSNGARIVFGVDTRLEGSRYLSTDYLADGRQGSYRMSNARASYETEDGRYVFTGFVNNIEDEVVFANSLQSPVKSGTVYNQVRPPRTYGVRVSAKF
ncbi:TonB-dependent receptor [Caulobacter hibisci]|uniref:TonB-dependent receptor n=1 Tax=Caulobacter hibisci TaxID=2035993 RepID=A0ABS0SWW9_9CAUL|nr:TonB-dependent receptor [Caulobacter hibisci]MBI1684094.1 TonB-dependent receptor [Caulobacter hibisci]